MPPAVFASETQPSKPAHTMDMNAAWLALYFDALPCQTVQGLAVAL